MYPLNGIDRVLANETFVLYDIVIIWWVRVARGGFSSPMTDWFYPVYKVSCKVYYIVEQGMIFCGRTNRKWKITFFWDFILRQIDRENESSVHVYNFYVDKSINADSYLTTNDSVFSKTKLYL